MKYLGLLTLIAAGAVLMLPPNALAQQTATVTGTVVDTTGALIPGVRVTATNNNTGISTFRLSGDAGSYTIPNLLPGPYTIVGSLPGFADRTLQVQLTPNQVYRFNIVLQVEALGTQIEVVSDADAQLATTSSSLGDALPQYEIEALPLATRDIFDLLSTTAGVVITAGGDGFHFAGTRNSAVNTTRDGVVVSDGRYLDWNGAYSATFTSPDLVEEVQISVGTVDASAARGSGQVRLQTRSGTNEYHGALFYTTNNSAFNANNWFDNLQGRPRDWTNRQQFGGRLGGPIIQNKAFFFVLVDEQRYRERTNQTGTVLTPLARQGMFRFWPGVTNQNASGTNPGVDASGNPVMPTGATGPLTTLNLFGLGNATRGSGITQNAYVQETLRRMPQPNNFRVGDGLNTAGIDWVRRTSGNDNAAGTSQNNNRHNLNLRLDYQINANHRVNFVWTRESNYNDSSEPTWPGGLKGNSTRNPRITTVGFTSTLSPTLVNEFRFGYRQTSWHGRPPYAEGCCFGNDELLGSSNLTDKALEAQSFFEVSNNYPYLPNLQSLPGTLWMTTPTFTTIRSQVSPLWQFGDTLNWNVGKHSLTMGWEGTWANSDGWNTGGLEPRVQLGDGAFPVNELNSVAGLNTTNRNLARAVLNDLSGSVGGLNQTFVVNDPSLGFEDILSTVKQSLNFHQDDWSAFLKDTWNVSSNLTLNFGVRWDVYGVPYEAKGLNVIATDNNYLGISNGTLTSFLPVGKNSPNPNIGTYPKDWNNIAPSVGFSYRVPWIGRTTVVRGGYGISYSGAATFLQYDFGTGRQAGKSYAASSQPLVYTALSGTTNPGAAPVDFPLPLTIEPFGTPTLDSSLRATGELYAYADNRRIPYIQNFNLSVETELARDTNLSVSYLGTLGRALWGGRQINEPRIFQNGILEAFNITRTGGNAPLFDQMFMGLNFGAGTCGVINGTTCTASSALRDWTQTDDFFADGEVARFAEFVTETNLGPGAAAGYGGLLRVNGFAENFIKVNPQFGQVDLYDNGDASSYHALQTQVTKRLSRGFSGQFTYTWSKALGNSGTETFQAREDQSFNTRDPNNRALQWGVVAFHRTHQFNTHGVWNLPFGPGQWLGANAPNWASRLIEGWQLAGIFGWDSGSPIPVQTGIETLSAENDINTPDIVGSFPRSLGKVVVDPSGSVRYLDGYTRVAEPVADYYGSNPDALQVHADLWQILDPSGNVVLKNPLPGTTGNMAYNYMTGPSRMQIDAALTKSFQIRENTRFTLRIDAINLLNTPRWGNPEMDINDPDFGLIDSATGQRTFTLNARVDF